MITIESDELLKEVKFIYPKSFNDSRGFFSEIYNKKTFDNNGLKLSFVQDNLSFTENKNVIRGLHFQFEPYAQDKLIRVLSGEILDVYVDIRKNSKTFGVHNKKKISFTENEWILIPKGFAHGFITLATNTTVLYKVTEFYNPESENGIIWSDNTLNIEWGSNNPELSEKDKLLGNFNEI